MQHTAEVAIAIAHTAKQIVTQSVVKQALFYAKFIRKQVAPVYHLLIQDYIRKLVIIPHIVGIVES